MAITEACTHQHIVNDVEGMQGMLSALLDGVRLSGHVDRIVRM